MELFEARDVLLLVLFVLLGAPAACSPALLLSCVLDVLVVLLPCARLCLVGHRCALSARSPRAACARVPCSRFVYGCRTCALGHFRFQAR